MRRHAASATPRSSRRSRRARNAHSLARSKAPQPGEWAFGAGDQAVTFVARTDAEHYLELGQSWYKRLNGYAATPGAESTEGTRYRTLDPGAGILRCFSCHSTGPPDLPHLPLAARAAGAQRGVVQRWGTINLYEFVTNSNYHALLVSLQHRLAHGFNMSASYTFSKVLDTSDSYSSAVDPFLDPRSRNYGPAGYDRRHVFAANFYWSLPKPGRALNLRPLGLVTDNWALSGVVRMNTGGPVTPG